MTRAIIIGGGLAGMTVAKELLKRGLDLVILEAGERLGGKAGADWDANNRVWEDHGYHVFPAWYTNTLQLLKEIGTYDSLIHFDKFHYLKQGGFPDVSTVVEFTTFRNKVRNVFSGLVPWWQLVLTYYFVVDLGSTGFSRRRFLDKVSANGFFRSRWYRNEGTAEVLQQSVLQASSIPNYEVSAMTIQNLARSWGANPTPIFSILNDNLQEKFIDPFEALLTKLGQPRIELRQRVKRLLINSNGRVSGVELDGEELTLDTSDNDIFVLATPPEVTKTFVKDDVYAAEHRQNKVSGGGPLFTVRSFFAERSLDLGRLPFNVKSALRKRKQKLPDNIEISDESISPEKRIWTVRDDDTNERLYSLRLKDRRVRVYPGHERSLSDLVYLETAPMAAFTLYLNRKLNELPKEHLILFKSRYLLSLIDISRHWNGLNGGNAVLSVIASDFEPLQHLSEKGMEYHIIDELERYLPVKGNVVRCYSHPNLEAQLFLNTVASWHFRPETRTRIENLYIAGDYCRSDADLTTMESVVYSGHKTAESILSDLKLNNDVGLLPLKKYSRNYWKLLKWGPLLPVLIVTKIYAFVATLLSSEK